MQNLVTFQWETHKAAVKNLLENRPTQNSRKIRIKNKNLPRKLKENNSGVEKENMLPDETPKLFFAEHASKKKCFLEKLKQSKTLHSNVLFTKPLESSASILSTKANSSLRIHSDILAAKSIKENSTKHLQTRKCDGISLNTDTNDIEDFFSPSTFINKCTRELKNLECTFKGAPTVLKNLAFVGERRRTSINATNNTKSDKIERKRSDQTKAVLYLPRRNTISADERRFPKRRLTCDDYMIHQSRVSYVVNEIPIPRLILKRLKSIPGNDYWISKPLLSSCIPEYDGSISATSELKLNAHDPKYQPYVKLDILPQDFLNSFRTKIINLEKKVEKLFEVPSHKVFGSTKKLMSNRTKVLSDNISGESLESQKKVQNTLILSAYKNGSKKIKKSKPIREKKFKRNPPNVLRNMVYKLADHCAICETRSRDLTSHYLNRHKTESYVSRLTLEKLEQTNVAISKSSSKSIKDKVYEITCKFCDEEIEDTLEAFLDHCTIHTGEYAFQCNLCRKRTPFEEDILSHQRHDRKCRNGEVCRIYEYGPDLSDIFLYACVDCNFVQLHKTNIRKHLRVQHQSFNDDQKRICKYKLVEIAKDTLEVGVVQERMTIEENIKAFQNDREQVIECLSVEQMMAELFQSQGEENVKDEANHSPKDRISSDIPLKMTHDTNFTTSGTANESKKTPPTVPCETPSKIDTPPPFEELIGNTVEVETVNSPAKGMREENVEPLGKSKSCSRIHKTTQKRQHTARTQYRKYSASGNSFSGLFKCMAIDCYFSTNIKDEMVQHLCAHCKSQCPSDGCLECSYCWSQSEYDNPQALVDHISFAHSNSRYQCPKCYYRSCVPRNVQIHHKVCHGEMTPKQSIDCSIDKANHVVDSAYILNEMANNVNRLSCPENDCFTKLWAISSMEEHLRTDHNLNMNELDATKLTQWTCIYCGKNIHKAKTVQEHLAISHPDKFPFVCERVLNSAAAKEDTVENLLLVDMILPGCRRNARQNLLTFTQNV